MKPRFLHDLKSLSLEDAIQRHRGEAEKVEHNFVQLTPGDRQRLLRFLKSL